MNIIHNGDSLSVLKTMEDNTVDCVVTSPPYWALRSYTDSDKELGKEKTYLQYIRDLVAIFDEVKRVLKPTGVCFVNIGDTYGGSGDKGEWKDPKNPKGRNGQTVSLNKSAVAKSLCQIPERFSIAMTDNGWIKRNTIIWYKSNAMPCSAKDRFTVDFEPVFMFTKNKDYNFNTQYEPLAKSTINKAETSSYVVKKGKSIGATQFSIDHSVDWKPNPKGRQMRCVWSIPTRASRIEHFATYPETLVERCILSGSNEGNIVIYPFCGVGTTGIVAIRNNRNFIGIELSEKYAQIAQKRLKEIENARETLFS